MAGMHPKDDPRIYRILDAVNFSELSLVTQHALLEQAIASISEDEPESIVRAMMTAWAIVDCVHRVRELAEGTPGLGKSCAERSRFLDATKVCHDFRNYIQHLRQELLKPDLDEFPVWGSFSWVDPSDQSTCCTVLTGTRVGKVSVQSCVYDRLERRWVSRTTLCLGRASLNIDPVVEETKAFCHFIQRWILGQKSGQIQIQYRLPIIRTKIIPGSGFDDASPTA